MRIKAPLIVGVFLAGVITAVVNLVLVDIANDEIAASQAMVGDALFMLDEANADLDRARQDAELAMSYAVEAYRTDEHGGLLAISMMPNTTLLFGPSSWQKPPSPPQRSGTPASSPQGLRARFRVPRIESLITPIPSRIVDRMEIRRPLRKPAKEGVLHGPGDRLRTALESAHHIARIGNRRD